MLNRSYRARVQLRVHTSTGSVSPPPFGTAPSSSSSSSSPAAPPSMHTLVAQIGRGLHFNEGARSGSTSTGSGPPGQPMLTQASPATSAAAGTAVDRITGHGLPSLTQSKSPVTLSPVLKLKTPSPAHAVHTGAGIKPFYFPRGEPTSPGSLQAQLVMEH